MIIRCIEEKDIEQVLAIYQPYVEHTGITFEYETPTLSAFQERVQTVTKQFPWIICEEDNEICAYAYASRMRERIAYAWDCELSIYSKETCAGKGIGTQLYEALLELVSELGYVQAYAWITPPNDASLALHKKFGFQEEGVLHQCGFKLDTWWDVIILRKQLCMLPSPQAMPKRIQDLSPAHVKEILSRKKVSV